MTRLTPWLGHYDSGVPAPRLRRIPPHAPRVRRGVGARAIRDHPAILFKGSTLTYGDARTPRATRARRRSPSLGIVAASASRCCCPTARNSSSPSWAPGRSARSSRLSTRSTLRRSSRPRFVKAERPRSSASRATTTRIKHVQPRTSLRQRDRDQHQRLLSADSETALHARARETRRRSRRGRPRAITISARSLDVTPERLRQRVAITADDPAVLLMSGGTTGTPKAALGAHRVYTYTGMQINNWNASVLRGPEDVCFVPLPLFHVYANVGIQALAFVNGSTLALVPESARFERSAGDDPSREAGVLQRRADAVHRAHQSSRRADAARSTSNRSASVSPARPRCSPTPSSASRR